MKPGLYWLTMRDFLRNPQVQISLSSGEREYLRQNPGTACVAFRATLCSGSHDNIKLIIVKETSNPMTLSPPTKPSSPPLPSASCHAPKSTESKSGMEK